MSKTIWVTQPHLGGEGPWHLIVGNGKRTLCGRDTTGWYTTSGHYWEGMPPADRCKVCAKKGQQ